MAVLPSCCPRRGLIRRRPHLTLLARAHADPQRRLQDDVVCADITGDGVVSVDDLLALLASYGSVDRYVDLTGNPEDRACEYVASRAAPCHIPS